MPLPRPTRASCRVAANRSCWRRQPPMAPVVCKILRMQTFPSLIAVLAGRAIAAEPKPPKLLDA
ncbi:MAG: hypothetical protein WDN06_18030 [Asticcacaulis sp.]